MCGIGALKWLGLCSNCADYGADSMPGSRACSLLASSYVQLPHLVVSELLTCFRLSTSSSRGLRFYHGYSLQEILP
jgi:hypothetical protein